MPDNINPSPGGTGAVDLNAWVTEFGASANATEQALAPDLQQVITLLGAPSPNAATVNPLLQNLHDRVQAIVNEMPVEEAEYVPNPTTGVMERPRRKRMSDLAYKLSAMML
ncbi:MAG: hypothetical protein H7330_06640 [Hymenobacteraceae bacterium]|nr:hypothetical protein [Hymenobacteraceae bacterium]